MNRTFSILLLFAMLLQIGSRPVIVANYELNKERVISLFCENKNLPELHCEGKCHLTKLLEKQEQNGQSQERTAEVSFHFLSGEARYRFELAAPAFPLAGLQHHATYREQAYLAPWHELLQPPKI